MNIYAENIDMSATDKPFLDFVYLHGKAEEKNGFDLCCIDAKDAKTLRHAKKYKGDVNVIFANGTQEICTLYFWCDEETVSHQHGLICCKDDIEANRYAQKKFAERSQFL